MGAMKQLVTGLRTVPTSERPSVRVNGHRMGPYVLEDLTGRRVASGRRVKA